MKFQIIYLTLFCLFTVIDGFEWFRMGEEYPFNAGFSKVSILGPTLVLLYIKDLPDVICNIAICDDDTNLHCKCNQTFDFWQQLNLASELESDELPC